MKLKDHVLIEGKTIRIKKDDKTAIVRIVKTNSFTGKMYSSRYRRVLPYQKIDQFFMDYWSLLKLKTGRYIMGGEIGRNWPHFFQTFEDCIAYLKKLGWKLQHPSHKLHIKGLKL